MLNEEKTITISLDEYNRLLESQKQVDELKEERENMQAEIIGLESQKEDLYFQNQNLQTYIDNHEAIWKRNTEQSVKDTAREICDLILEHWEKKQFVECDWLRVAIAEKYGVEVE